MYIMHDVKTIEKIFTEKYNNNSWLGRESKSGPGSSMAANKKMLELLEMFCKERNIKSIIDCGCGDFNWMKAFDFNLIDYYVGVDVVKPMIEKNITDFSTQKILFDNANIITDDIPNGEVVLCKDVLCHLSFNDACKAIDNIKKAKPKYFISTTFYEYINADIPTGEWRPINLESPPFNLRENIILWKNIENRTDRFVSKSMGIWEVNK